MTTAELLDELAQIFPRETCIVCSLGRTSEEVFHRFPHNTLFLDSMGDVASVACGLALAISPRPVVAIDTDGSHLFGLANLPTIAALSSRLTNLALLVLDNVLYESGGSLPSRLCKLDWKHLGKAFDLSIVVAEDREQLESSLEDVFRKLIYTVVNINNPELPANATKSIDGVESRYRFIRHIEHLTGRTILYPAVKS